MKLLLKIAKSGLKKYDLYLYISYILHTSIIERGFIDARFLHVIKHYNWVVIPRYVLKGLTLNMKMGHKKTIFTKFSRLCSCCICTDGSPPGKQKSNLESCKIFVKCFWVLRTVKQEIE